MSWRLTPSNTAGRGRQASRRKPRTSTDPAPLCPDRWAEVSRVAGLLARRNESRDPCTAPLPRSQPVFPAWPMLQNSHP
eukprot:7215349-Pyramimonas_sp.AAC.1